ncbi:MAG TPA: nickel-type superoxide dismutase maturation protease [Acidimicrobiia bacterium]|nr:nickel-type superoxide dismutase maturation protease [Acidimicrobiia bacterium]
MSRSIPAALAAALGAALRLRLTRYEVAEDSMIPTLHPGDWVLGVRRPGRLGRGDIVVVDHPHRPGFELVKRVTEIGPSGVAVAGDNPDHSTDSRHFGPVARAAVHARLLLVYRPRPLRPL